MKVERVHDETIITVTRQDYDNLRMVIHYGIRFLTETAKDGEECGATVAAADLYKAAADCGTILYQLEKIDADQVKGLTLEAK